MRKINRIVLHCSASDSPIHDDINVIKDWHLERGFKSVGYHYLIQKSGTIQMGRPEAQEGAHVKGANGDSIGICLSGLNTFTNDQFRTLARLVEHLKNKYKLRNDSVQGHNEFPSAIEQVKTCPNFDVQRFIRIYLAADPPMKKTKSKPAEKK